MTTKFKVENVADPNIDDAEETLVSPLEFALVKYLNSDHRRFI